MSVVEAENLQMCETKHVLIVVYLIILLFFLKN